jgi:hypothetical protein
MAYRVRPDALSQQRGTRSAGLLEMPPHYRVNPVSRDRLAQLVQKDRLVLRLFRVSRSSSFAVSGHSGHWRVLRPFPRSRTSLIALGTKIQICNLQRGGFGNTRTGVVEEQQKRSYSASLNPLGPLTRIGVPKDTLSEDSHVTAKAVVAIVRIRVATMPAH